MPDDFVIARNPDADSALPYLLRIPLGPNGIVLKARETWPRTSKVFCHRAQWPEEPEIIERVATRSCVRRGAAIDLVLDRGREARSQLVLTYARGREAIFWQTARTAKQARPAVRTPTARAAGRADLTILVDVHERYAWKFADQQASTRKQPLLAGDYAVEIDGRVVAAVERKSLDDLVTTLVGGKLRYLLADLAALPRAALVVEDRYSQVFALRRVRPAIVADGIAEAQARFPSVPIVFAETRALAQEWSYRFLAACLDELEADAPAADRLADVPDAGPLARDAATDRKTAAAERRRAADRAREATVAAGGIPVARIRSWAREHGYAVSDRGRLGAEVIAAFHAAVSPDK